MTSVDLVGQYFPLAVAVPIDKRIGLAAMLQAARRRYPQAEKLARVCLDEDFDWVAIACMGKWRSPLLDDPVAACSDLVAPAKRNANRDKVTVIVVRTQ